MNLRRAGVEQRSWAFFLRLLGEILLLWKEALWGHIWLHLSMNMGRCGRLHQVDSGVLLQRTGAGSTPVA